MQPNTLEKWRYYRMNTDKHRWNKRLYDKIELEIFEWEIIRVKIVVEKLKQDSEWNTISRAKLKLLNYCSSF